MSVPIIYANTQYIAAKHIFKTIPSDINQSLTSLIGVPTCNVMTIMSSNVGIGTTIPRQLLDVNGNLQTNSLGVGVAASGTLGEIRATNDITAFYSDMRLKTNIADIDNALDKVLKIRGVYYTQNKHAESFGYSNYDLQVGVLAQEVQEVLPEVVKLAPFDIDKEGKSISGENYLTVKYDKIIPLLINAIKEQQNEINKIKDLLYNNK